MGEITLHVPNHIAALIQERQGETHSEMYDAILGAPKFPYPKISTKGSRFRLVQGGAEQLIKELEFPVILLRANPRVSKIFYSKPYDPNATDPRPDCFSNDGLTPDASVAMPIAEQCAKCPNNVLGSKITNSGNKTTACQSQRHLAVLTAANPSDVTAYLLTVPVSGMKAYREYLQELKNYGVEPHWVATVLSFDPEADYPRLTFARGPYLSAEQIKTVESFVAENEQMLKEITREVPFTTTGLISAETTDDEEDEAPTPSPAPQKLTAGKPAKKVAAEAEDNPVSASKSQMQSKLDSIFPES